MIDFDLSTGMAQTFLKRNKNFEGIVSSIKTPLMALLLLAACDGNSLITPVDPVPPDPTTEDVHGVFPLLPGTAKPTSTGSIARNEAKDSTGNGYAENITYHADSDTFSVDGLAFDGDNVYQRDNQVASLGSYAVYESDSTYADDLTGTPIDQSLHRTLYGVSTSGQTEFAIVRTGAYIRYGFGGFVYQRNGGVILPNNGQAHYQGDYAGLRDFDGQSGLQYTTGDMTMAIDFNDFNSGNGVQGSVTNRAILDINGNDITATVLADLNTQLSASMTELPTLTFSVSPGVMDSNGEIAGGVGSFYTDSNGATVAYESGNYYAIVAGDDAEEVVGVIVVEAPTTSGTVRETGGFILYRE